MKLPIGNSVCQPVFSPLSRSVAGAGAGGALTSLSALKKSLSSDASNINVLVLGDSTGNETTEWAYLFATFLAAQYPAYSVDYYLWGGSAYGSATSLSTGTGSHKLNFWNFSVPSTLPRNVAGAGLAAGVTATNASAVFWNFGKNFVSGSPPPDSARLGDYYGPMETVRQALPSATHTVLLQSPNRDDNDMAAVIAFMQTMIAAYGDVSVADAYSIFVAAGKPADWYIDNVHPSELGSKDGFLAAVILAWSMSRPDTFTPSAALTNTKVANALINGDFASFGGASPDSWTAGATPTITKDLSVVDTAMGNTYSVKLSGTAAMQRIQQDVTGSALDALKGGTVSLSVRQYVAAAAGSNSGRISVAVTAGGTTTITDSGSSQGYGGWRWRCITGVDVPSNATQIRVTLYCNTAASSGTDVYFGRAVLCGGSVPRNMT